MDLKLPGRLIAFPRRPLVMGIVNINDDSFSGDGSLDVGEAIELARSQIHDGADIIDVGAESARTNRRAISVQEEVARFSPFIDHWEELVAETKPRDEAQIWPPILSANTWRPEAAAEILQSGKIDILNDMGALPDARNADLCAKAGAALLIMHSIGEPKIPHLQQQWSDVMGSMIEFFAEKIDLAIGAGLEPEAIILDPGIDFAKQRDDNLAAYRQLADLQRFARPVLVPVSRKTVIGEVLGLEDPRDRDAGGIACIATSMARGGNIFRVHQVKPAWQAIRTIWSLGT